MQRAAVVSIYVCAVLLETADLCGRWGARSNGGGGGGGGSFERWGGGGGGGSFERNPSNPPWLRACIRIRHI